LEFRNFGFYRFLQKNLAKCFDKSSQNKGENQQQALLLLRHPSFQLKPYFVLAVTFFTAIVKLQGIFSNVYFTITFHSSFFSRQNTIWIIKMPGSTLVGLA
jgi:hypothetical protein